ncbi:kinase-like domain-containing protein [Aspergillus avenaceus]|uniref:Kinase-like domain-containing protein n=1 Tax=Aspergillus avenaceus TaxID=36643 RepID=A0A5N6TX79_ASPAV|nr:kinase-like domain-containing protein [Aspergillus avenaceus]
MSNSRFRKPADVQLTVQYQKGLDIVGVGAAGQVYNVDEHIVLKACRIYEPPSEQDTPRASPCCGSSPRIRTRNIIEAIHTDHPEGIYLRKYQPLSALAPTSSSQSDRVHWYRDLLRALLHLHRLGIAHADLRRDNVLFDHRRHALLSDFGAACPFGRPNPSLPVLLLNGPSETVSAATDHFAMGSLIYELETGARPDLSADDHGALVLPQIHTRHAGLDALVENAWRGHYARTEDMLEHADCLDALPDSREPYERPIPRAELTARITQWRNTRQEHHGCVLYSLPTDLQLHILAERYGWNLDDELRFP